MAFPDDEDEGDMFSSDEGSEDFDNDGEEARETNAGIDTPPETYPSPSAQTVPRRRMVDVAAPAQVMSDPKKPRTRPLPVELRRKWPDVNTMLITNMDGSQIFFVR